MSPNGEYVFTVDTDRPISGTTFYDFINGSSFVVDVPGFYVEAISNNGIAVDADYAVNVNDKTFIKFKTPVDANGNPIIIASSNMEVQAYADMISDDGSTAIGMMDHHADGELAAKWNTTTGDYTYLNVAQGFTVSYASATNADASIIAGTALDDYNNLTKSQLVLWKNGSTEATTIHEATGDVYYVPTSMTASGHALAGVALSSADGLQENSAFYWTEADGVTSIYDHLKANGIALSNHSLDTATSISDDGTLVSGTGDIEGVEQAWLARITPVGSGVVSLSDTQTSLFSMGMSAYYMLPTLLADNMRLNGQNCDGGKGQFCAFATAAVQKWDESQTDGALSRIGAGYNLKDNFAIGGLIGYHQMDSDNDYSRFTTDGLTLGLWTSYNQQKAGLQAAANISYSFGDMDTDRFYYNGAEREVAKGSTGYDALSLSASLGYGFKIRPNALVIPFIDLSYIKANIDGFDEETALFQASYKDLDSRLWQNHLGVKGRYQLNNKLALLAGLAWGHGMVQDTKVSASLKEAAGFGSVEHITVKHEDSDWANISAGVDYKISEQMNVQFSAESNMGDEYMIAPRFNGQIKFQINF